ncbi:MAG TPA: ATP-binding protein [Pyrinomonadaceae bacterium]|jgi:two-component system phosphate regulon sensor histidine kinase PhoR|nr:ATP-binding protein [Pyrinomonadaceae bacterium]
MSSRLIFAVLVGVALAVACGALFVWNPLMALVASVSLLAGAAAARMFPRKDSGADSESVKGRAGASGLSGAQASRLPGKRTGGERHVALDVPASALLEATMESMREGVLVIDGETRVLASNRAMREIFGEGGAVLRARRLSELTRNPLIHAAFQAALERGERAEAKVETLDAERRVYDLRVAPLQPRASLREPRGGAIGVFFNITRLERLERVRQEFLSNVSHELRTPLTAILTFVETLEDGAIDDPEHSQRFLSIIRRNAERMHNLINDILELSGIEAGTAEVEVEEVRLRALVEDVLTALGARAAERRVVLLNEVDAGASVFADARRLEQMLTNLVDNAIKFNVEGGTVSVGHERIARADRINVTDTGEGIAPRYLPRIFERFYRVDRARSRALGGTGLGLAIVKHLARAHGGEATVRSTPGQGSTFILELPRLVNRE